MNEKGVRNRRTKKVRACVWTEKVSALLLGSESGYNHNPNQSHNPQQPRRSAQYTSYTVIPNFSQAPLSLTYIFIQLSVLWINNISPFKLDQTRIGGLLQIFSSPPISFCLLLHVFSGCPWSSMIIIGRVIITIIPANSMEYGLLSCNLMKLKVLYC